MNQFMQPSDKSEAAIFEAALACATPHERIAYLDKACAGRPDLRQRIEALLAASDDASSFLEPAPGVNPTVRLEFAGDEKPGDVIGQYKIREKIGEGGCGVVYVADQEQPVRRRVALKVVKLGMDTKQVVARFEAERQALALMDHPNIAKVLDAGATSTGRPFFVMELVRGIKITDYCDQNNLSTEERLKLFIQVCHAVQHAHQKGIIHRDIKPSNVLVTLHDGVPVPKVIDFGIAKATSDQRLTDKTIYTAFEQFLGTPAYMSPEQAEMSGLDIDTRSDIYSLGVLLYELLTGKTPFDPKTLMQAGIDQMRRIIREQEPPRPSTCLSTLTHADLTTLAKQRHAEAPKLIHLIAGDLDWIVMKCLEKDRTRRYETANGLATEIQRHLSNEPITARPPSAMYRIQKTVRRNKLAFAAISTVLLTLVIGLAASIFFYQRESRARLIASTLATEAQETSMRTRKALSDVFAITEATAGVRKGRRGKQPVPSEILLAESAVENYEEFLKQSPNDDALKADLAEIYQLQAKIFRSREDFDRLDISRKAGRERDELQTTISERAIVITNAIAKSCTLLAELVANYPKEQRYRDSLASGYTLASKFQPGTEAHTSLKRALLLRTSLVQEFPEDLKLVESLADLYPALANSTTNDVDREFYIKSELPLRQKLAARMGGDSETVAADFFKLAGTYSRLARMSGDKARVAINLSNAIATIDTDWNRFLRAGVDTNMPAVQSEKVAALVQYQSRLARELASSGSANDAAYWARQCVHTAEQIAGSGEDYAEGAVIDAYIELGDMLNNAGREREAAEEYRRAMERLQGLARRTSYYYSRVNTEGGSFSKIRYADLELDALWDKLIRKDLSSTNLDQAEKLADEAVTYWRARYAENQNYWRKVFTLSQLRSASIHQMTGRTNEAGSNIHSANLLIEKLAKDQNEDLVELAKILAGRLGSGPKTNMALLALDAAYSEHAVSAISHAGSQTNYAFPAELLAASEFKRLAKAEGFQATISQWQSRSDQKTNELSKTMSTADLDAISYAESNDKKIRFKGTVSHTGWSPNGKTFFMAFEGANHNDFKAVIRQTEMHGIVSKLGGGDLEKTLHPGVTVELEAIPSIFQEQLQLRLSRPQEVLSVTSQISQQDGNGQQTQNKSKITLMPKNQDGDPGSQIKTVSSNTLSNIISVAETDLLRTDTNKLTTVFGTVHSVQLSGQRFVIHFFESKLNDSFRAYISTNRARDFSDAIGGTLPDVLPGKVLHVEGYPRVSAQGNVTITIESLGNVRLEGQQLKLKQTAIWQTSTNTFQTLSSSNPSLIKAAIGSAAVIEGTISEARWNERKTVLLIEFEKPGFLATMSAKNITNVLKHLSGDPVKNLSEKPVRLKGDIKIYGGVVREYKGWAEIFLKEPEQLEVME